MHQRSRNSGAGRAPGLDPGLIQDLCVRAGDPVGFERWQAQVRAAGCCQQPVRLDGGVDQVDTATGEARSLFDSKGLSAYTFTCRSAYGLTCRSG